MAARRFSNCAFNVLKRNNNSSNNNNNALILRRKFSTPPSSGNKRHLWCLTKFVIGTGGAVVGTLVARHFIQPSHSVVTAAKGEVKGGGLSRREQRFHDFASCEVNGQIVMTPYDFIESLIENEPKVPRHGKVRMTEKDIGRIIAKTPSVKGGGSTTFFRDMHQDGMITYSEYLFLVTILTKSNAGLKIALKMMDVNGDKMINLQEFKLIERMINQSASQSTCGVEEGEEEPPATTLFLHLFGADGTRDVSFEEFFKFMDNLQSEVLELEFHEYSKGMRFISEVDFAKILLRNTTLTEQEYRTYIDRLKERIDVPRGISIAQFKAFNNFLSNIDDFLIAVAMTNSSGQDLDKEFFERAVQIVTGVTIDPYIIDIVFSLFDDDGNEKLSQEEFIGIMKDRLKRGFGKFPNISGLRGFKHCLKKEMIKSAE